MNCKKYINMLPLYATGDLDKAELDNVKAHLDSCDKCRDEFKQLNELVSSLRTNSNTGLSDFEKLKLENNILRKLTKEKILNVPVQRSSISINLLRIAAAVILFFMGFSIKSIMTEPETKEEFNNAQVMLTSLERTEAQRSIPSGMRFSEAGFKLIASGKSSGKIDLNNN